MSLKQRAVQCSGYIPASQYVPVYSRPHRTNHGRWHEEIAPITPKPNFDDPDNVRTQSIHDAVKQWLDSSPNSVIGPLYRSRSPSSGSPPSNGDLIEQKTPRGPDTPPWTSNTDRLYDAAGAGGLSPKQVSIEQSTALHSGSSASSPRPADRADSRRWDSTDTNGAQDVAGTAAALPTLQESGVQSPERVVPKEDGKSGGSSANDAVPANNSQESCGANNQVLSHDNDPSAARAEEGTGNPDPVRRGGRKRPITEMRSPDQQPPYGLSSGALSGFNSRAASREFDNELALVVREIEKHSPRHSLSCASVNSSVGALEVLLKPPRGQKKNAPHDTDNSLPLTTTPHFPGQAVSARDAQNSPVLPPLPRATSGTEDRHAAVMLSPSFHQVVGPAEDTIRIGSGETANETAEIVPASVSEIVESGVGEEEVVCEGKQKLVPTNSIEQKIPGYRASLQKIDDSLVEVGPKTRASDVPRLTLKDVFENEKNLAAQQAAQLAAQLAAQQAAQQSKTKPSESVAAQQSKTKSSDSPVVISNGVAAVAGGFEFRSERPSGRTRSSHSPGGGSLASTPNNVPQQYIYKVSPLHQMARKANRSKRQNAVSPASSTVESEHQLRRDKSTRSTKSVERATSLKIEALDIAKVEELRKKADAWENAKNATILSRYKREESKIHAWEERKVAKAAVMLSKVESDLDKNKAKALEKMQYEVEQAHKKAAEKKAHAEAKRAERAAKAAVQAQVLRVLGKSPLSCFCS